MKNLLTHPGFLLGMLLVACSEYPIETPNPEQEIATRASARSESKDYYWSGGRKIYLDVDPTEMIVGFETAQEKEMFTADISAKNPYAEWSMALVKINDEKAKVKISADKLKKKKVSAYKYSGYDAPFLMTGDILMQPKEGVTTEEILEKFAVDADSVEETDVAVVVHLKDWSRILSTANAIYESGMVDWCHPNFMSQKEKMTNDQYFGQQYYLKNIGQNGGTRGIDINVEPAWAITTGAGIRVAVIDDGVEAHDDLAGRVLNGFTPQNPNGNNGNGGNGRPLPTIYNSYGERIGHGQACAGIIAASHNSGNSSYIAGIAPGVQIIPINTFYGGEDIYDDAAAIEYAWDPKRGNADVISNSWSYDVVPRNADVLNQQINNAVTQGRLRNGDRKGCVVVFSAGNNSRNTSVNYPGTLSSVITVGAVDKYGNVWNYSNRGTGLDVVAPSGGPSGDVYTLDRMNSYGYNSGNHVTDFNGTSAAAPQVSGIAALLLSVYPDLTAAQVKRAIERSGRRENRNNEVGYGLVNALKALYAPASITGVPSTINTCTNVRATLSGLPNIPYTITWRGTPGIQIVSGQGTQTVTFRKQAGSNELTSILYADIYHNGSKLITITSGGMDSAPATLTSIEVMGGNNNIGGMVFELIANPQAPLSNALWTYEWRSSNPDKAVLYYSSQNGGLGKYEEYLHCSEPGTYYIECRPKTPCGTGQWVGIEIIAY